MEGDRLRHSVGHNISNVINNIICNEVDNILAKKIRIITDENLYSNIGINIWMIIRGDINKR